MTLITSILQGGTNSHETSSEEANTFGTDFISEGIVGAYTNTAGVAPATGAYAVNAQGTPDMTVAVSAGVAYVTATPTSGASQLLRVKSNASENVTISANSTGGTRFDWVYIKIDPDKAKDPNSAASDVATLVTSRSTSATTDNGTPPTYGYPIAVVTVANGASSITNGNISDAREQTGPNSLADNGMADWKTWPISFNNLSGGTLNYAKHVKVGKTVFFRWKYTLGGAGVSGAVTFTTPTEINSDLNNVGEPIPGQLSLVDTGTTVWIGVMLWASSTTAQIYAQNAGASYVAFANLGSTVPHTWASTDVIACSGFYEEES